MTAASTATTAATTGRARLVPAVVLSATPPGTTWRLADGGSIDTLLVEPVPRLSSLLMIRDAVLAEGGGAGLLPRFIVADDLVNGCLPCRAPPGRHLGAAGRPQAR